MTDAWEPANQLEHQLRDALRDGDQDTYFALVSGAELFVPLPPGETDPAANQTAFTWPTNNRDGRTHVLAYSSAEAGTACLGPTYQQFVRMTLADMARSWPDQEWWLALNSGLPIEGYLPAWFIGRLTAGTGPIPGESPTLDQTPPPGFVHDAVPPASVGEAQPLDVPPASVPDGMHAQGTMPVPAPPVVVPDAAPLPAQNGVHPGSVPEEASIETTVHDGIPVMPMHDPATPGAPVPDAVSAPLPETVPPPPPAPVPVPVPEGAPPVQEAVPLAQDAPPAGPFEVDESPVVLHFTPDAEFTPLDEEERTLVEAATRGDRKEFLRTLLDVRQIWVPVVEGGDLMLAPGRPGFQWYVDDSSGRPIVPLFTGPGRMRDAMGGHPFVLSDLAKVLRFWPDPALELVVNGGTAIGASVSGDRVTMMSGQVDADAAARLASDFPAQSDAERQMFDVRTDPDMVVKVLMDTTVFLPVWSRTPPAVQTRPGDPEFPWSAVPVRGRPSVLAFTSFDWMKAAVGTTGFVMPTFAELIASWPEHDWGVSVNPGTPIEVALAGEQIRALGASSAGRLTDTMPPPLPADGALPLSGTAAPAAEPPRHEDTSAPQGDSARLDAPPVPEARRDEPADSPPGPWAIMQKVVPHEQVAWHLEQAYDRVAGFVHRVQDVVDLNTPKLLYDSLGLLRDGSPFSADDTEVHVIRWPAYRSGLYRIPFGGQSDEAVRAWGDSGWVLELPPFGGDGFAPGSAGSIREYKVDSMRLPHGSEMYAIGSDGSERFVARYDADRLVWGDNE
ncbi:MAG: hypothetical protein JWP48_5878 [Actinoallomurus sp.]|jgi:hypothetical protein|nr:hypothetical protein [Actinoallomurus sp.]